MIIGTGGGGIELGERQYREFFTDGQKRVTPYAIPVSICGMLSSEISIALQLHGISHVLSTGCTSSTDATGYALSLLRAGEADALLCGGVDACVTPGMIYGFSRMRVVSTRYNDSPGTSSRPFDRGRDGFVLGEGAWMYVLEREDRARARGAHVYAAVDGYGSTCDAYHRVQMDPEGTQIIRAIDLALARAGRAPEAVGLRELPRDIHAAQRCDRSALCAGGVRRARGRGCAARRPSRWSDTRRARAARAASSRRRWPSTAASCRRRSTSTTRTRPATWTCCPTSAAPRMIEAALCNCLGFGSKNSAVVLANGDA